MKLVYLAIPYSYNPEESFKIANAVAADLMSQGYAVFSPVSHSHPISFELHPDLQLDHDFWMNQDLPILTKCEEMFVVNVDAIFGPCLIEKSRGLQREILTAKENNIPITYITYGTDWQKVQ